jgi:hypothetical protein
MRPFDALLLFRARRRSPLHPRLRIWGMKRALLKGMVIEGTMGRRHRKQRIPLVAVQHQSK